ncbi:hypothetical protein FQZ97_951810 [compost metagenome]
MPTGESDASAFARSAAMGNASTRHENAKRPGASKAASNLRRKMLTELSAFTRNDGRANTSTGSYATKRLPGKANGCHAIALCGVINSRSAVRSNANWRPEATTSLSLSPASGGTVQATTPRVRKSTPSQRPCMNARTKVEGHEKGSQGCMLQMSQQGPINILISGIFVIVLI